MPCTLLLVERAFIIMACTIYIYYLRITWILLISTFLIISTGLPIYPKWLIVSVETIFFVQTQFFLYLLYTHYRYLFICRFAFYLWGQPFLDLHFCKSLQRTIYLSSNFFVKIFCHTFSSS